MPSTLPNLAEDDRLLEIVDGQRVEAPPMGRFAAVFATLLAHKILSYALPRKLGIAPTEGLIDLGPGQNQRRSDVSYFRFGEWPVADEIDASTVLPGFKLPLTDLCDMLKKGS